MLGTEIESRRNVLDREVKVRSDVFDPCGVVVIGDELGNRADTDPVRECPLRRDAL
jgi:hypothetical protein